MRYSGAEREEVVLKMITYTDIVNRNNLHSDELRYQYAASIVEQDPARAAFIAMQLMGRNLGKELFPTLKNLVINNLDRLPPSDRLKAFSGSTDDYTIALDAFFIADRLLYNLDRLDGLDLPSMTDNQLRQKAEELSSAPTNFKKWVPPEVKDFRPYFFRGSVEMITLDTSYFLDNFREIYSAAPMRYLSLKNYGGLFPELIASGSLQGIVYLDLDGKHLKADQKMSDNDLALLASSDSVKDLKMLRIENNNITDQGLLSLAMSSKFPELRHVSFGGNAAAEDSAHYVCFSDFVGPEDYDLTKLGRKLREINPDALWLQPSAGYMPLLEEL